MDIGSYIKIAGIAAIIILLGSAYFYFDWSQKQLAIYAENQAKLEQAVETQRSAFNDLYNQTQKVLTETNKLSKKINDIDTDTKKIKNSLQKIDLRNQALADPTKLELKINKASDKIIDRLQGVGK